MYLYFWTLTSYDVSSLSCSSQAVDREEHYNSEPISECLKIRSASHVYFDYYYDTHFLFQTLKCIITLPVFRCKMIIVFTVLSNICSQESSVGNGLLSFSITQMTKQWEVMHLLQNFALKIGWCQYLVMQLSCCCLLSVKSACHSSTDVEWLVQMSWSHVLLRSASWLHISTSITWPLLSLVPTMSSSENAWLPATTADWLEWDINCNSQATPQRYHWILKLWLFFLLLWRVYVYN